MRVVDGLNIVEKPTILPGMCMATLSSEDPQGFIDTLLSPACVDPRVYISVSWIEETAKKLGMVYPDDPEGQTARIRDLEEQLKEADKQLHAIEVMESAGFVARKAKKAPAKKAPAKTKKAAK